MFEKRQDNNIFNTSELKLIESLLVEHFSKCYGLSINFPHAKKLADETENLLKKVRKLIN